MKNLNKLLFLVLLLLSTAVIISCSKDDDEDSIPFTSNMIVAGWEIIESNSSNSSFKVGGWAEFKNDGSCRGFSSMETSYKIQDGKIHTYYGRTGEPMFVYTLISQGKTAKGANTLKVRVDGTLDDHSSCTITMEKYDMPASSSN